MSIKSELFFKVFLEFAHFSILAIITLIPELLIKCISNETVRATPYLPALIEKPANSSIS
jgi:hypothetical protein